jgi:hypothetical protein
MHKENTMFPTNEMVLTAEVAYRREQLLAARPRPLARRTPHRMRLTKLRPQPKSGPCLTAA